MGQLEHPQRRLGLRSEDPVDGTWIVTLGIERCLDAHDQQLERIGVSSPHEERMNGCR